MRCYEEHQLSFDEAATGTRPDTYIETVEVILTDRSGKKYHIVLEDTPQRHITAQITTRRLVDAPAGYLTATSDKVGMASATVHLTGLVKENLDVNA